MEYKSLIQNEARKIIFPNTSEKRSKWTPLLKFGKSVIKKFKKPWKILSWLGTLVGVVMIPLSISIRPILH